MKPVVLIFKLILFLALIAALILGGLILYATITNYEPEELTKETPIGSGNAKIESSELSFLIWNLGFCGLGAESDFFYDGGKMVVPPKENVNKNYAGEEAFLKTMTDVDFIMLQEVDFGSKRSHFINMKEMLGKSFPNRNLCTALNYNVQYIPIPFTSPMGKVNSGLMTMTPYKSTENTRYQFPGNFSWPKSLYFLDRCFLLQRFPVKDGKDLIIINTHNSAYDDGSLKAKQMEYMKAVLEEEYAKGNYIVVGGDWNQLPPGFDPSIFDKPGQDQKVHERAIDFDYMPEGWTWAYDPRVSTNRKLKKPYDKMKTKTTLIDFYLLSPNLKIQSITGFDLDYQFTDHQPVRLGVELL